MPSSSHVFFIQNLGFTLVILLFATLVLENKALLPEHIANLASGSVDQDVVYNPLENQSLFRIDTFAFSSNGSTFRGKIFSPSSQSQDKNLSAIFLIDFTEQHFKLVTDEFERVIDGVQQVPGLEALVVTLEKIPDIDAEPETFQAHYQLYKDMAAHVHGTYTSNTSRTLIGKGSESGIVLMALLRDHSETAVFDNFIATDPSGLYTSKIIRLLESEDFSKQKSHKKLHFSFSTSNDRVKCNRLIQLLHDGQYPWLEFESKEYTSSNYENTYPISFAEGIRFIFSQ